MRKNLKKIGLSSIWLVLVGIMIWREEYNIPLLAMIATVLFFIWAVDLTTISNLSFDWANKKVEMNRMYEETKRTANEVEINAKTFNKTIKAFLSFNLTDLQTEGLMFQSIPWRDAANFVNESIELRNVLNENDDELSYLVLKSKSKVIELFKMDVHSLFPDYEKEYEKYISSGFEYTKDQAIYDPTKIAIDFEGLYDLGKRFDQEKQLIWKRNVDDLKTYYEKNF